MDENPAENSLYLLRFLKYFISNTSKRFLSEEVGKEMLSFFDVHNAASIFHSNSGKRIHSYKRSQWLHKRKTDIISV